MAQSPIRVEDIDYLCKHTKEGDVLRVLLCDALTAHCSQEDVFEIEFFLKAVRESPLDGKGKPEIPSTLALDWVVLIAKHKDLTKRVLGSRGIADHHRARLLRPVEEYIAGKTGRAEEEFEEFKEKGRKEGMVDRLLRPAEGRGRRVDVRTEMDAKRMRSPGRRKSTGSRAVEDAKKWLEASRARKQDVEDVYMTEDEDMF